MIRAPLIYHYTIALVGFVILLLVTPASLAASNFAELLLFLGMSIMVKRAGFHVAPKVTHSLVGIVDVAALMVFGAAGAAWVAAPSGFISTYLIALRDKHIPRHDLLELASFSFGLKVLMAMIGSTLYFAIGGVREPALVLSPQNIIPVFGLCVGWFLLDHLAWVLAEALANGIAGAITFLRRVAKASITVELLPLPLSALLAFLFVTLDRGVFLLVAVGSVGVSVAVQRVADLAQVNRKREVELQTLNDFGRELSAARMDEQQILELVFRYAARVADTSDFAISLIDEQTREVDLRLRNRAGERQPPRFYPLGGLSAWVADNRRPLLLHDFTKETVPARAQVLTDEQTRSALFVPMISTEKVIGVISLQSQQPNQFTADHERIFSAMANQAAVAIEQARLYRAEQRRARQLETIAEVSQRVAGIFELEDLMGFVVALLKVNFDYYHVDIYLLDGDLLVHHAGTELEETSHPFVTIDETSLIGTVAKSGEPLLVNDVTQEQRYSFDPAAPNTAAELVVPLKAEGKLLGVLEVQSDQTGSFSPSDLFVMQTLGDQVALAIQEAELFTNMQQEAYISNALLQVSEAVGSLADINEILQTLVRITPLLVGVERCLVLMWDAQTSMLVGAEAYGLNDESLREFKGRRHTLAEIFSDPDHFMTAREFTLSPELAERWQTANALVLPLLIRGSLIGAFCVDAPYPLDERRFRLLIGIANQAALAIETVQLEMARDIQARLDQELMIGRTIQSSLLPDRPPMVEGFDLAAIWKPALQVAGDFYDFLPLLDEQWGIVIADVADKGVPAAIYMTLARTIIRAIGLGRATRRTPHQVLERANEIIMSDARTDLFVTVFYAVLDRQRKTLCYTSAGHNPPLWWRCQDETVEMLSSRGMALGVLSTVELYEHELSLQSGDIVVFYTDGVTEATNTDDEMFGLERLREAVTCAEHDSAQSVMDTLLNAVQEFVGRQEQTDDLTVVVLRCR